MIEKILASLKGHAPLREILKGLTSKLNQDKEKNLPEKWKHLNLFASLYALRALRDSV